MGYLSLYKTLADYNKDASNRQNPHVSLITDDKKLILINSSNVSKEISNVKIIESLTPGTDYPDYNDFPTDTQTIMPVGIKIYTDNSQKSKETNKQLFDNYIHWSNKSGRAAITVSVACVDDIIYNNVITYLGMKDTGELKVDNFYTISSDGSIVVVKNIHDGGTPDTPENDTTTTTSSELPTTTTSDTTPTPIPGGETYETLKCDKCGYIYTPDGEDNVCPKCGGQGTEIDTTTPTTSPTTTPTTTPPAGGTYYTEMPISVKMLDGNGNETETLAVTFDIDCNGYSKSITLYRSGTLSGYHPYDNNTIDSFSITCEPGKMYYKENGEYIPMPEITSYSQFSSYYHKGGAIYVIGEDILPSTLPPTESTSPTSSPTTSPNPNE